MPPTNPAPLSGLPSNLGNPNVANSLPPTTPSTPRPGALVPYNPPPTPVYPRPIGGGPPPRAPIPRLPGGAPRGVGGAFRVPPGLGGAARGGAALVGRRIPWIALGFVAFDAFVLACAAGILPGNICPRPDNPAPGATFEDFRGGQCPVVYELFIEVFNAIIGGFRSNGGSTQQVRGPVYGLVYRKSGSSESGAGWQCLIKHTNSSGGIQESFHAGSSGGAIVWKSYAVIRSIRRVDGLPDNCGDPPPVPSPRELPPQIQNISNFNNNININILILKLNPPSPNPKRPPIIQSPPAPLPDVIVGGNNGSFDGSDQTDNYDVEYVFNPQPSINSGDQDYFFRNFPPGGQPNLNNPDPRPSLNPPPPPPPVLIQLPPIPPPTPPEIPPESTPPDIYQYRQNREILDKLYRVNAEILDIQATLARQNLILENLQRLIDFEIEGSQVIRRCDDIDFIYSYKDKILPAINRQLNHLKSIDQIIIDEICQVEKESVLASPDWWQVRLKGDTPQLALIFRVGKSRTYHKLTVPHPFNTNRLLTAPIPSYTKGNWQGEIVCIDNSKFLCNCATKEEAERLIQIAISLIDPVFLGDPVRAYFAERKGVAVGIGDMIATSALYFPFGQQQTKPAWRVTFTGFGI